MALPKIQQPLFELTIPSSKKTVKYRPFTVKEEKVLLIAQESKEIKQIVLSIKQIINNCVEDVNVEELAMFDMEYILISLRAKSVNNLIEFKVKDKDTEEEIDLQIDIDDIKIHENENHNSIIKLTDVITIKMKYPKIDQLSFLEGAETESEQNEALFKMMVGCIDTVVQGEDVYKLSDFTQKEVDEFVDGFTSDHVNKIKTFFDTMPVLRFEKKYKSADGKEKTFIAQGTETFFI